MHEYRYIINSVESNIMYIREGFILHHELVTKSAEVEDLNGLDKISARSSSNCVEGRKRKRLVDEVESFRNGRQIRYSKHQPHFLT